MCERRQRGTGYHGCRCHESIPSEALSPLDELLTAIYVVSCPGDRCVRHEVDRELSNVRRADHSPDGKCFAELLAATFPLIAEQRCRQRRAADATARDQCADSTGLAPSTH